MNFVAGSNVFNQWFSKDTIISEFCNIPLKTNCNIDFKDAKIVDVNWSYNIFEIGSKYYLTGSWDGSECVKEVIIPEECTPQNITIIGNEYNVVLADKTKKSLWISKYEPTLQFKRVSLIETQLENVQKMSKRGTSKLVSNNRNTIYLTESGSVYCGVLPSLINTEHCIGNVCDIACGNEHFLLLTDAGRVYTWGNGRRLQLGHGDVSNLDIPTEVEALAGLKITKISAGGWHSLALSEFGDVYSWGWNDRGQLGIEDTDKTGKNFSYPTLVELNVQNNIVDVACGSRHSAVMLEDNSVWTVGYNEYGQLGFQPDICDSTDTFRKSFQCDRKSKLICGPWTTVIVSK